MKKEDPETLYIDGDGGESNAPSEKVPQARLQGVSGS